MLNAQKVHTPLNNSQELVTVLGAGAWGTALAIHLAQQTKVRLWGRDPIQMQALQKTRCNERYLPKVVLPENIDCTSDLEKAIQDVNHILIATPSSALPSLFNQIKPFLTKHTHLLFATKGLYPETSELLPSWLDTLDISYGILSGPSFAKEVANGLPTSISLASSFADCLNSWKQKLHTPYFQVFPTQDVMGVALCGAMKNVIAIAVGLAEGLALGQNMNAFLITQGLLEMRTLGAKLSADPDTFLAPCGIGDLTLTAMSCQSRNQRLGVLIGQGLSITEAQAQLGLLSEGILNARAICELAQHHLLTLPLCKMVYTVLFDGLPSREAVSYFINDIASHVSK